MTISLRENREKFESHMNSKSNPHGVTPEQIGASPEDHDHKDLYYTKSEVDTKLTEGSSAPAVTDPDGGEWKWGMDSNGQVYLEKTN
jgi:hypothetical protein